MNILLFHRRVFVFSFWEYSLLKQAQQGSSRECPENAYSLIVQSIISKLDHFHNQHQK